MTNNLRKNLSLFLILLGTCSCSQETNIVNYDVIPMPQEVKSTGSGTYTLSGQAITIGYPEQAKKMQQNAEFLAEYLQQITGTKASVVSGEGDITLALCGDIKETDGYKLSVDEHGVQIHGASEAGVFYGIQTLRKSLEATTNGEDIALPFVEINDYPRFSYRGVMLDASRHFMSMEEMKTFIDILALHNLNRLHWHITDDQGWRIEIKKYPRLTEIGANRRETVIGHNSGEYDGKPYGGFYSQEQIKELIAYADAQHVVIVPEIDLPGHQLAALASYPELGCTGGPYDVWCQWGVSHDVICAGNEKAMLFLEDVLSEVIELFPSEYIHIGGDECPKTEWAKCPKCQRQIRKLGIKGDETHSPEEYLQSYVISRMEKFVQSKGRRIIGWDEILEGGLPKNATVMSWRGEAGGLEAARLGHDVIMTPNTYLYFDYYQSMDTDTEPTAIGGYLPLELVYGYNPIPEGFDEEAAKHIIGVQANMWREYMPTASQVQYMLLPRINALAEIQWSNPASKNYNKFLTRVDRMNKKYEALGYNYATHIYDIKRSFESNSKNAVLTMILDKLGSGEIYYTTDGTTPTSESTLYTKPIAINEDAHIQAVVIRANDEKSRVFSEKIFISKSTGKPITLNVEPSDNYKYEGAKTLNDGLVGNGNYRTGLWLGFQDRSLEAVIDLTEVQEISKVSFNNNIMKSEWIVGAQGATVRVSEDGKNYTTVAQETYTETVESDKNGTETNVITFEPIKARFVEVVIKSATLPKWHPSAGKDGFLFVDEISVN